MLTNKGLVNLCKDILDYIGSEDEEMPEASHDGPCYPDAGCDGACMDRYYVARANGLRDRIRNILADVSVTDKPIVAHFNLLFNGIPTAIAEGGMNKYNTLFIDQILLNSIFDLLRSYVAWANDAGMYSAELQQEHSLELYERANKLYEAIHDLNNGLPKGLWDILNYSERL